MLAVSVLFTFCKKEVIDPENTVVTNNVEVELGKSNPIEYLVFGYIPAWGNIPIYYKLENQQIIKEDPGPSNPELLTFQNPPLPNAEYQLAEDLLANLPSELLQTTNCKIGCANCWDQGTIYIEVKVNGEVKSWRVDPDGRYEDPSEIVDYVFDVWDVWVALYY